KDTPGWTKPRRVVVPTSLMPAKIAELKRVAPEIEFIPVKNAEDAAKMAGDADAVFGFCTPEIVKAGKNLRWIQVAHAGVEKDISPELLNSKIVLTNTSRIYGPQVADQAFVLLLCLTRGEVRALHLDEKSDASEKRPLWERLKDGVKPEELRGKA